MKTITEFSGPSLQNALKTKQALVAAGKTAEELAAAMGEALKLEGDKLTVLLGAIEVVEKKPQDLKRVVVWSLQEGEKPPRGTEQKGEHHFGVEYFPPMPGAQRGRPGKGRGERERGGKGGRGGRGDRRGKRDGRGPRGSRRPDEGAQAPRAAGAPGASAGEGSGPVGGPAEDQKRRRRRRRGPRKEGAGPQASAGPQAGAAQPVSRGIITPRPGVVIPTRPPKEPAEPSATAGAASGSEAAATESPKENS